MPPITSRPPTSTTAAIESVGRKSRPGRNAASTRAWRRTPSRTSSAFPAKRAWTSSSRPNACTISIPTTASSAASVTSAFSCCTWREIGITLRANVKASTKTAGMAISATAASLALTKNRTTEIPMIIITDWMPCVMPQPMKYRMG